MGRKQSDNYDFGEPGKCGEDNSEDRGYDEQEVG